MWGGEEVEGDGEEREKKKEERVDFSFKKTKHDGEISRLLSLL